MQGGVVGEELMSGRYQCEGADDKGVSFAEGNRWRRGSGHDDQQATLKVSYKCL